MNINWPIDHDMGLGWRHQYFRTAIDLYKPKSFCEIGCHTGKSGTTVVQYALQYVDDFFFDGYDLFELANDDTHKQEINGKGSGNYEACLGRFTKLRDRSKKQGKRLTFNLHKGFTQDTLTDKFFDMVFIDGGHSYDTVMYDYDKVKNSKVIFFDDYDIPDVQKACDEIGATNLITWKSKKKLAVLIND
jgi:hypothetical protein